MLQSTVPREDVEFYYVHKGLNQTAAAAALGISRMVLRGLMARYAIRPRPSGTRNGVIEMMYRVDPQTGCWLWQRSTDQLGYGRFRRPGHHHYAHRMMWELRNGPVPDGLELDHLCRVRRCVNPKHLEPVTHSENMRRGYAARRAAA